MHYHQHFRRKTGPPHLAEKDYNVTVKGGSLIARSDLEAEPPESRVTEPSVSFKTVMSLEESLENMMV